MSLPDRDGPVDPFDRLSKGGQSNLGRPTIPPLTPEQIQLVTNYRKESFWYKCVPFTAFNCMLVSIFARQGRLKRHPRIGYFRQYAAAVLLGFIGGRLIGMPELKRQLRELEANRSLEMGKEDSGGEVSEDDTTRAFVSDDNSPPQESEMKSEGRPSFTTYDELRKQNRRDFKEAPQPTTLEPRDFRPHHRNREPPKTEPKRNQYGDIIEES